VSYPSPSCLINVTFINSTWQYMILCPMSMFLQVQPLFGWRQQKWRLLPPCGTLWLRKVLTVTATIPAVPCLPWLGNEKAVKPINNPVANPGFWKWGTVLKHWRRANQGLQASMGRIWEGCPLPRKFFELYLEVACFGPFWGDAF